MAVREDTDNKYAVSDNKRKYLASFIRLSLQGYIMRLLKSEYINEQILNKITVYLKCFHSESRCITGDHSILFSLISQNFKVGV